MLVAAKYAVEVMGVVGAIGAIFVVVGAGIAVVLLA